MSKNWTFSPVGGCGFARGETSKRCKTVDLMWGKAAPVKVSLAGSNLFVFSFDNSLARDWVLENGPWHVQHKPLFLRKWEPNLKELHFDLDRMPIWIQLFNVPLELFSKKGLSYIASAIDKPLHMDSITASRARLEYARVCVEISVGSKIPDFVDVLLYDESVVRIKIFVPWLPASCVECMKFGHLMKFCPLGKKKEQVWKAKAPPQEIKQGVIDNSLAGLEVMSDGVETIPAQEKIVNTSPTEIVVKCSGLCTESSNFSEQSIPNNGTLVEVMCAGKVHADSSRDNMAGLNAHVGNSGSNPPIKRGRGRPAKEPKAALGALKNKFESVSIKGSFEGQSFCVTAVYGLNDGNARRHLWNQLISLDIVNLPWLVGGDFNIILNTEESSGSINSSTLADISDFRSCVENLGVFDHPFTGPLLTWSNKQQDSYLARKLDRVLVNSAWIDAFPESDVEFLTPGDSDHCPAVMWLRKAAPVPVEGNPAQVLFQKLKRLKCPLRYLNKSHFNDISNQVKLKREELMCIQLVNLSVGSIVNDEMQAERELHSLEEAEMLFYKQKAKVSWINEGDQGTRFFHSMVARKRKSSTIRLLFDQSGTRLDTFDDMANEVIKLFQYQLGTTDANVKGCSTTTIKDLLNYSLSLGADTVLCRDVSDVEIREALWGQGNDKSPGPDGYNPFFYKVAWPIIGVDFTTTVRYCFDNSFILPAFNSTAVVIVPKVPNPSLVKDFRPISCCIVIYKTITRILVKRLSVVFPDMVTKNQTAFVKGRNIVDNTLLAQEIVRGYNRKNISPRCTLKIDLQKAFDSLDWNFILVTLKALGLPEKFIGWIGACFSKPSYSIMFNGSLVGYFRGGRSVRQGDPLSPYLFVLAMNVLSNLLNVAALRGIFKFHPKCKRIGLTHLCFADDLLIFCEASIDSIIGVQTVLDVFYSFSGLKLNINKCEMFVAGISADQCRYLSVNTGFKVGSSLCDTWVSRWQIMVPAEVIRRVEQLCSRFFWKGANLPAKGARVSWKQICLLKSEGGLGVIDILGWNKACFVKLIRNLLAEEGSLWVAWIRSYIIKSSDFWQLNLPSNASWYFRRLLKLRHAAHHLFVNRGKELSTRQIWEAIRPEAPKVVWHHLVWFAGRIPKYCIILWMAILDRLPTRIRLLRMGLAIDNDKCLLCNLESETRNHLFFECDYARNLWKAILQLCGVNRRASH
ncbi:uncharacterized protein LOC120152010 [Hibiscus syriacus]|uniref:uncharacterized protein LOC120152010 n=1 Tax=Hibiscus syriacus TaxID=106335 RepID=UPI00192262AA|nr:uncharacterized protein LOC120152010 [Hibiscus syriacus]